MAFANSLKSELRLCAQLCSGQEGVWAGHQACPGPRVAEAVAPHLISGGANPDREGEGPRAAATWVPPGGSSAPRGPPCSCHDPHLGAPDAQV